MIMTTRSGLTPDSSARFSLSEKARIDFPVRVRCRNQCSHATTSAVVTSVMVCAVRSGQRLRQTRPFAKLRGGEDKSRPVGELPILDADDDAHHTAHDEHDTEMKPSRG